LETIPVRGTLTYKGQPISGGILKFLPTDGAKGRPAIATTESDGSYSVVTLNDSPGLVPGEYVVTATNAGPGAARTDKATDRQSPRTRSDLSLTVKPDDKIKVFNISLD
jgi:hypothetical protein